MRRGPGFDLGVGVERRWNTSGPKLAGQLHFVAGDVDDVHLDLAVHDVETFPDGTTERMTPHPLAQPSPRNRVWNGSRNVRESLSFVPSRNTTTASPPNHGCTSCTRDRFTR